MFDDQEISLNINYAELYTANPNEFNFHSINEYLTGLNEVLNRFTSNSELPNKQAMLDTWKSPRTFSIKLCSSVDDISGDKAPYMSYFVLHFDNNNTALTLSVNKNYWATNIYFMSDLQIKELLKGSIEEYGLIDVPYKVVQDYCTHKQSLQDQMDRVRKYLQDDSIQLQVDYKTVIERVTAYNFSFDQVCEYVKYFGNSIEKFAVADDMVMEALQEAWTNKIVTITQLDNVEKSPVKYVGGFYIAFRFIDGHPDILCNNDYWCCNVSDLGYLDWTPLL